MNYFVYILYSPTFIRTYVGQTNNLDNRLSIHNSGKVKSTKTYKPWILIHSESFSSRSDVMKKEKWFKSSTGRKKIAELIQIYFSTEGNGWSLSELEAHL